MEIPLPGIPSRSVSYVDDGRKRFAASLAKLIAESDLRSDPLTVGISGPWGSGKSLALDVLKSKLREHGLLVVEFCPWQSSSPQSLIEDFFKTLAEAIKPVSSKLSKALNRYADNLLYIDLGKRFNRLLRFIKVVTHNYLSINKAHAEVEDDLSKLPQSVAVIIDDVDRLDSDELFETLRLVRNTAHFKNVAYILAYDKPYVEAMLRGKGIANAEGYLEKIFRLSLPLPAHENYTFAGVVVGQLARKYGKDSYDYKQWRQLVQLYYPKKPEFLLNSMISNYRQAVSLASFLITRFEILKELMPDYKENVSIEEWYCLQLLCFFYPELYAALESSPTSLLKYDDELASGDSVLAYNSDKFERLEKNVKDESPSSHPVHNAMGLYGAKVLLQIMFGAKAKSRKPFSIRFSKNYHNYFALRVLNDKLSEGEFIKLLNAPSMNFEDVLLSWQSRTPSIAESVSSMFEHHPLDQLSDAQGARFIRAMLLWWMRTADPRILKALENLSNFSPSHSYAYSLTIKDLLQKEPDDFNLLCSAIVAQAPPLSVAEREAGNKSYLLTIDEVESFFQILVDKVFEAGAVVSVDDLSIKDSVLNTLLFNSSNGLGLSNYAIEPVMKALLKMTANDSRTYGRDLNSLIALYSPETSPSGLQILGANTRKVWQMFGGPVNLRNIIITLYEAPDDEKAKAIKALGLNPESPF